MKKIIMLSAVAGVLTLSGCTTMKDMMGISDSGMQEVQATVNNTAPVTSINGVLVDSVNRMTLYTFDKDSMNKSECGSVCTVAWPAFMAPSNAKATSQFSTFQREDGTYQWAANGKPLYFYANDTKVGDTDGDNKLGIWHAVRTQ